MGIEDEEGWVKPDGWTGPAPILYWSLDTLEGLVLMEGTQQTNFDALTDGKVSGCSFSQSGLSPQSRC